MIKRPGAWAVDGSAMQTLAVGAIQDLCFIDGRDEEFAERQSSVMMYGKLGVGGAFDAVFGGDCNYATEVASVFAHIAVRLGYLEPTRRLSQLEFRSLLSKARARY